MNNAPTSKLDRFRHFAGLAWALSRPYFFGDEKWRARGLLAKV